jgi:hypothetical protein
MGIESIVKIGIALFITTLVTIAVFDLNKMNKL